MEYRKQPFFVLAHNIRSLHNVGSIFRVCDVFAVDKLFLSGFTGRPPEPRLTKVSLGAEQTVPWQYSLSSIRIIKRLRQEYPDLQVIGLENNLRDSTHVYVLPKTPPPQPVLLVLGEEVKGISSKLKKECDGFLEIPQLGSKESLNVSVAFGIAAYVLRFG